MNERTPQEVMYARALPRVQALVLDLIVYFVGTLVWVVWMSAANSDVVVRVGGIGFVAFLVLYEPIMVWRLGGTLGHLRKNLRVVSDKTGRNPSLFACFVRWLVKGIVGALSLFFMALTKRHQALHDSASRTTVQIRDAARARPTDFAVARTELVAAPGVSVRRRLVVILGYQLLIFLAISLIPIPFMSEACLWEDVCTDGEDVLWTVSGMVWTVLAGATLVLGWQSRLFGARARVVSHSSQRRRISLMGLISRSFGGIADRHWTDPRDRVPWTVWLEDGGDNAFLSFGREGEVHKVKVDFEDGPEHLSSEELQRFLDDARASS